MIHAAGKTCSRRAPKGKHTAAEACQDRRDTLKRTHTKMHRITMKYESLYFNKDRDSYCHVCRGLPYGTFTEQGNLSGGQNPPGSIYLHCSAGLTDCYRRRGEDRAALSTATTYKRKIQNMPSGTFSFTTFCTHSCHFVTVTAIIALNIKRQ